MTLKALVAPLVSFFSGADILGYIKIVLVLGAVTFVGFLWVDRANLQVKLAKSQADTVVVQSQLAQVTSDIRDVRVKQELAIQERDEIRAQTEKMLVAVQAQKVPTDCKELVKWAVKNKNDTKW
jgi:hypothetical protein